MKIFGAILFLSLFTEHIFSTNSEKQIAYFIRPFDEDEIKIKTGFAVNFPDSVIRDSIYLLLSGENVPLAYSCNIQTEVCSDKECLPLSIELFWEPTGVHVTSQYLLVT